MRIDVHHHFHDDPAHATILQKILSKVEQVYQQGVKVLAKVDELKAELVAANETTNEIADDVTDLLNKLAAGGLSPAEADEVKAQIVALNEKLKGVAAQHTPGSPV
jgi:uncharacterized coiled-coil DUF342 family protein